MVTTIRSGRGVRSPDPASMSEGLAGRTAGGPIPFVPHPSFDDPAVLDRILNKDFDGLGPERRSDGEPMDPEQEARLFLRMNALKCRAEQVRSRIDPRSPDPGEVDRVSRLMAEATGVMHRIILANRPLVSAIARRYARPSRDIQDLIAEGTVPLILAAEKFDVSRGFKFSTYATWAITHQLNRRLGRDLTHLARFRSEAEEVVKSAADDRQDESEQKMIVEQLREAVDRLLGGLEERERRIVIDRFGLSGNKEQSLRAIGKRMGVSGERVRQIERSARRKMLRVARRERLDLLFS